MRVVGQHPANMLQIACMLREGEIQLVLVHGEIPQHISLHFSPVEVELTQQG